MIGAQVYLETKIFEYLVIVEITQCKVKETVLVSYQCVSERLLFGIVVLVYGIEGNFELFSVCSLQAFIQRFGATNQLVEHIEQYPVLCLRAFQSYFWQEHSAPAKYLVGHFLFVPPIVFEASEFLLHPYCIFLFKE